MESNPGCGDPFPTSPDFDTIAAFLNEAGLDTIFGHNELNTAGAVAASAAAPHATSTVPPTAQCDAFGAYRTPVPGSRGPVPGADPGLNAMLGRREASTTADPSSSSTIPPIAGPQGPEAAPISSAEVPLLPVTPGQGAGAWGATYGIAIGDSAAGWGNLGQEDLFRGGDSGNGMSPEATDGVCSADGDRSEGLNKKRKDTLEKNRRNQKKFRERQKAKMVGLEKDVQELTTQVQRLKFENSSLMNQNDLLCKVLQMKEGQIKVLRQGTKGEQEGEDVASSSSESLLPGSAGDRKLSKSKVASLENVIQQYKEYSQRLSDLLVSKDAKGGSPEEDEEIKQKMAEVREMLAKLVVLRPTCGALFNEDLNRGPDQPQKVEVRRSNEELMGSLNMTDDQQRLLVALKRNFHANLKRIRDKQIQLNADLQRHMGTEVRPGIATHRVAEMSVKMDEIMKELKDTVDFERTEYVNFVSSLFELVLVPIQGARMIVHAYPYYPDVMGFASFATEDAEKRGLNVSSNKS